MARAIPICSGRRCRCSSRMPIRTAAKPKAKALSSRVARTTRKSRREAVTPRLVLTQSAARSQTGQALVVRQSIEDSSRPYFPALGAKVPAGSYEAPGRIVENVKLATLRLRSARSPGHVRTSRCIRSRPGRSAVRRCQPPGRARRWRRPPGMASDRRCCRASP